jgi:pimeloyl-ACP methyl ester carboxylesterase
LSVVGVVQNERPSLGDLFLPGSSTNRPELVFFEPYRTGKIPVVFIHGLLSEPATWVDVANDLRASPQVTDRYQIWVFSYPTVDPFLEPAAALREQLQQAVSAIDPSGADPALRNIILVGHSMGGLIAKLQITHSGTTLWNAFANRPPEMIVADDAVKARLYRHFFFVPSPNVRRVVFVGSPHAGSSLASQSLGRLASSCVEMSPESKQAHQQLIQYNPSTFSPAITYGFPNSIDLLQPSSPLLAAMRQLPVNPAARMHTVIGHGYPMLSAGDSDGVVPVSSARHPGVQTETMVRAWHTEVHAHPDTLRALLFIFELHYAEYLASIGQQ